jgi:predicted dithiol-disulfide oxidoreductase (DUF899 family)
MLCDALGDLSLLKNRDTTFVVVSRAPLAKVDAYKAKRGWSIAWVSSFGSDFNYDFHVTLDPKIAPPNTTIETSMRWRRRRATPSLWKVRSMA